jgi:hypothetical protein
MLFYSRIFNILFFKEEIKFFGIFDVMNLFSVKYFVKIVIKIILFFKYLKINNNLYF